jgi:hypothetical protein
MGTTGDFITVMLPAPLVKALERHIQEEAPGKTRSDVLRGVFEQWCIDRGYIRPEGGGLGTSEH